MGRVERCPNNAYTVAITPGTLVRINGTGFTTATAAGIDGVSVSNAQFIGPGEIHLTLGGAADLRGKRVGRAESGWGPGGVLFGYRGYTGFGAGESCVQTRW
jgi:hypothetical protein